MKNKRGFLLAEETLKILIAVISIGFLIYFLTALYFAKINEQEKRQAEATLERISLIIQGANQIEQIHDPTPEGWTLFSFIGEAVKPNSCVGENCLCICDPVIINFANRQIKECDEDGFCKVVKNLENFEKIKIKQSPFSIEIQKDVQTNKIIIQEK